jgi:hypothetical protein
MLLSVKGYDIFVLLVISHYLPDVAVLAHVALERRVK